MRLQPHLQTGSQNGLTVGGADGSVVVHRRSNERHKSTRMTGIDRRGEYGTLFHDDIPQTIRRQRIGRKGGHGTDFSRRHRQGGEEELVVGIVHQPPGLDFLQGIPRKIFIDRQG